MHSSETFMTITELIVGEDFNPLYIENIEDHEELIPRSFPRPRSDWRGPLPPQFSDVAYLGRYYEPFTTPSRIFVEWSNAEIRAQYLALQIKEDVRCKREKWKRGELLDDCYNRIQPENCDEKQELDWTFRRAAELIGCKPPRAAITRKSDAPAKIMERLSRKAIGEFRSVHEMQRGTWKHPFMSQSA